MRMQLSIKRGGGEQAGESDPGKSITIDVYPKPPADRALWQQAKLLSHSRAIRQVSRERVLP